MSGIFVEQWLPRHPRREGFAGLLTGTILVALVAVVIAVPLSVLASLFITEYASARLRKWLIGVVDLLAAVPSLLFGLWGFLYLSGQVIPLSRWLSEHLGFIPFFSPDPDANYSGSIFIASSRRPTSSPWSRASCPRSA